MDRRESDEQKLGISSKDMLGMPYKDSILMAQKLIKGKLVVGPWFKEEMEYHIEEFDWNINFSASPTTFLLYLHALRPVAYLVASFVHTQNIKEFNLAYQFVQSWQNNVPQNIEIKQGSYYWEQHAVAQRTEALLYFMLVGCEHEIFSDIEQVNLKNLLIRHGNYLADNQYYLPNENHGVFEDRALLYLGYSLHRNDWVDLAIQRVRRQWDSLFTSQGVCIENSYAYHCVNRNAFLEISKFLETHKNMQGKKLFKGILLAEKFMGYALLPDGTSPAYGDSQRGDYTCSRQIGAYVCGNPDANCPVERSVVYQDAGYFFGREFWSPPSDTLEFKDSFWTMFRSGFQSITHRHADDNSFQLYARGHLVLIDSGMYNYMFRDPRRIYVRSANAHNTVIVDGQSYDFLRLDSIGLSGFASCSLKSKIDNGLSCDYVVAYNRHYCGVLHIRHFFYFDTDVVLVDEIRSRMRHTYSQLFHCGKNIHFTQASKEKTILRIGNGGYELQILQKISCDELQLFNGMTQGVLYGNASEQFNELFSVDTLKYDLEGDNVFFVTQLSLQKSSEGNSRLCVQMDFVARELIVIQSSGEKTVFKLDPCKYQPGLAFRFPMDQFSFHQKDSVVTFINEAVYNDLVEHAWYLLNPDGKTVRRKTAYQVTPSFQVDAKVDSLEEGAIYSVRAFIYSRQIGRKASQMVATLCMRNGELSIVPCLKYDKNLKAWMGEV